MRNKNIKCIYFLLLLLFIKINGYSQLNFEQILNIKVGETFAESKTKIKSLFSQKATIMKSDFYGAYKIEYENVPFSYYGDANYTFQYAKDTLIFINIDFLFVARDTIKFRRLYNTLIGDLNNDKTKTLIKQYSNLKSKDIFQYVNSNCITTTEKENPNYKPIKTKFLGQSYWGINTNSQYFEKFIRFIVQLSEIHGIVSNYDNANRYNGGQVELTLQFYNDKFADLQNQLESFDIASYRQIADDEAQIKLKFQNGVYLVPVKLNNTLLIDFVLDLGASDVSISPDVFLVLYKAGTIKDDDFIGSQTYQFADGSTAKSSVFNIKSIQIGDKEIKNVRVSISNSLNSPLLLGQSALKQLTGYRIDNDKKLLIIE